MTLKEAARQLRAMAGADTYVSISVAANYHAYVDGRGYLASAGTLALLLAACLDILTAPTAALDVDADALQPPSEQDVAAASSTPDESAPSAAADIPF